MTQRPNPPHTSFGDLEGKTIVKTAEVNRPFDDDVLLGTLDDQGHVWLSRSDVDQQDEAYIQLGLWTREDRDQFYEEKRKVQVDRAKLQQEAAERATYERLRAKFDGS